MRSKRIPNTPTQRYLQHLDACRSGRQATGRKTLSKMFNTTRSSVFIAWYVAKAISERHGYHSPEHIALHRDEHYVKPLLFTPKEMRAWAETYNLTIPLGV